MNGRGEEGVDSDSLLQDSTWLLEHTWYLQPTSNKELAVVRP